MTAERVCPAHALAHVGGTAFVDGLSDVERRVLAHVLELWARPEQLFPEGDWRSLGYICGRGWGKTEAIGRGINLGVESGRIRAPALGGPTVDRVNDVQIKTLIDTAPFWFKPERWHDTIRWPNGVVAETHYATEPNRPRSSNFDFTWLCEIVGWQESTRADFFECITTATRVGRAQFVWDTTSKGINEVILTLLAMHRRDPAANLLQRGTTFDNPILSVKYLRDEVAKYTGQSLDEELGGKVKTSAAGALWDKTVLDLTRAQARPMRPRITLVAVDPAQSTSLDADETGIIVGDAADQTGGRHSYVHTDETGRHSVPSWSKIAVDWCEREAAGVVIERSKIGDAAAHAIVSEARTRDMAVVYLNRDASKEPFPLRRPGTIFIREVLTPTSKGARAEGPAAEYAAGRGHLVGDAMKKLEHQLCNYVPGRTSKSPNNYDAHAHLVTELAGLAHELPGARSRDVTATATAMAELQRRLLVAAAGRRIG